MKFIKKKLKTHSELAITKKHKLLADLSHGKILDIGFAEDPNTFLKDPVGIDIQVPKKPANYKKVAKHDLNNEKMPFTKESFDTVLAGDIIEHVYNPSFFLMECNRVLKRGGSLVLSTPNAHYYGEIMSNLRMKDLGDLAHLHIFTKQLLIRLLDRNGFKIKKIYGTFIQIPFIKFKLYNTRFPMLSNQIIYHATKTGSVTNKIRVGTNDNRYMDVSSPLKRT